MNLIFLIFFSPKITFFGHKCSFIFHVFIFFWQKILFLKIIKNDSFVKMTKKKKMMKGQFLNLGFQKSFFIISPFLLYSCNDI